MASSILKPFGVLLLISAIAAALLGYVNEITKEPIAEQNAKTAADAMKDVLSDAASFDEAVIVSETDTVRSYNTARDAGGNVVGYAVTAASKGYGGDVVIMVGLNVDGSINAINVTDNSNETPGLGANSSNDDFKSQYKGKTADTIIKVSKTPTNKTDEIQAITSATITSTSVTNSVNAVLAFYNDTLSNGDTESNKEETPSVVEPDTEITTEEITSSEAEPSSEEASEAEQEESQENEPETPSDEAPNPDDISAVNEEISNEWDNWDNTNDWNESNDWNNNEFEGGNYQ